VTPDTRKIALRSAMIMSPDRGGVFDTLLRLVRFGLLLRFELPSIRTRDIGLRSRGQVLP